MEDWHAEVQARRVARQQRREERIKYEEAWPQRVMLGAVELVLTLALVWAVSVLFLI